MTTRKRKTTKTKKVEAVVDYDGHDVVEEIKEPKVAPVPHLYTMKIYQKSGIGKPDAFIGRVHFSEKREHVFANPVTNDDLIRIVSSGYQAKGITYSAHTKDWILNLQDAVLPDLMYADPDSYIIGVE